VGRGWVIASLPIVERWIVEPSMDIRSSVWVVSVLSALWGCGVVCTYMGFLYLMGSCCRYSYGCSRVGGRGRCSNMCSIGCVYLVNGHIGHASRCPCKPFWGTLPVWGVRVPGSPHSGYRTIERLLARPLAYLPDIRDH
jgi:hypothetical protein